MGRASLSTNPEVSWDDQDHIQMWPANLPKNFILKEQMFDTNGQWIRLETFDDFDNGLDELIDLWSTSASKTIKESTLAHFKEDLDAATLEWLDNKAKSKKYATIAHELAEFEVVLAGASATIPGG